jgi:phosphoribosylglycinamide formyltransferase-1
MPMKNIVVLISGNGSNLQSIIDAVEADHINGKVTKVISNRPDAYGLSRAKNHDIEAVCLDHTAFESRESYDAALINTIDPASTDLLVLAGFMRILTEEFVNTFNGKVINIHPSLLPKYKGLNTHQRAIDSGDKEHGVSVHFVTPELDGGPVVIQSKVPVFENDVAEDLAQRVQEQERQIYPLVVKWFCEDRLTMQNNQAFLDGNCLPVNGYAND